MEPSYFELDNFLIEYPLDSLFNFWGLYMCVVLVCDLTVR